MTDRLDRLERHLDHVLAGPRRLMRSLSKTAIGTYAMTAQNETVAAVLADLKMLVDSDALESVYARLESALTKAEAVEPVTTGCVHHDFSIIDPYIRNLRWSHDTTTEVRDAVASNLRGLYTHLLTRGLFAGSGSWDAGRLAAAKWVEKRRCAFADEYGLVDHSTGVLEFGNGFPERDEYYCELSEIEEAIRALPAPQFVAHTVPDEMTAVYMLGKIDGRRERHPLDEPAVPVESLCSDCPPVGYPTEATRCTPCPRRCEPVASVPDGCPQGEVSCDDCGGREFGVYNKNAAVLFCHDCGQFTTLKPTNQEGAAP